MHCLLCSKQSVNRSSIMVIYIYAISLKRHLVQFLFFIIPIYASAFTEFNELMWHVFQFNYSNCR